jgi:hypothetical protein
MGLLDILKQYSATGAPPDSDVADHFDSVAQQANPSHLGSGIASALRSEATPSFGHTIGSLFGQSNPEQKAGVLNEILQGLGPTGLAGSSGGILGRILGTGVNSSIPVTAAQAAEVSPADMSTIAASAQQHDDSIIDRVGSFYAQHPALVKTLGVAALGVVMTHMNQLQRT